MPIAALDPDGHSNRAPQPISKTTAQQQKLQALPPGRLAQITKNGQTFYVFPDAANNRAFVGGPDQYQALVNYRLSQHLAAEQLATSTAYADPSLGWDTWNGWPGTYGHSDESHGGPLGGVITAMRPTIGAPMSAGIFRIIVNVTDGLVARQAKAIP